MKIILIEDVDTLGDKEDIKDVAPGYARNYLIPQGFAVKATPSELNQRDQRVKFAQRREKKIEKELAGRMSDIHGAGLEVEENAAYDGKLYGSVTARIIADMLSERLGIDINKKRVDLETPIKKVGEYKVSVDLGGDKEAEITVKVSPVGGKLPDPPPEVLAEMKKAEAAAKAKEAAEAAEAPEAEEPAEDAAPEAEAEAPAEEAAEEAAEETAEEPEAAAEETAEAEAPAEDAAEEPAEEQEDTKE